MINQFNPSSHIIQISTNQGKKDYLPVQYRLVWFRAECPEGTIETELIHIDLDRECEHEVSIWNDEKRRYDKVIKRARGIAIFKATVTDGKGGVATGTKMENAAAFSDWLEKAETGAIGRGLAALGYGTQFTGDELDEGTDRIADSPVSRQAPQQERKPAYDNDGPATQQQLQTVKKLRTLLSMPQDDLDGLNFGDVAALITELSKRLQEQKKKAVSWRVGLPSGAFFIGDGYGGTHLFQRIEACLAALSWRLSSRCDYAQQPL